MPQIKDLRKKMRANTFIRYSEKGSLPEEIKKRDPVGTLMLANAQLLKETQNFVIGKAMTTAAPQCDFVIQLGVR